MLLFGKFPFINVLLQPGLVEAVKKLNTHNAHHHLYMSNYYVLLYSQQGTRYTVQVFTYLKPP